MNRDIVWTKQFKKDYKRALKRGRNIDLLDNIIRVLSQGGTLPEKNQDHALSGDWTGHRECHISPYRHAQRPIWQIAKQGKRGERPLFFFFKRSGTPNREAGANGSSGLWKPWF